MTIPHVSETLDKSVGAKNGFLHMQLRDLLYIIGIVATCLVIYFTRENKSTETSSQQTEQLKQLNQSVTTTNSNVTNLTEKVNQINTAGTQHEQTTATFGTAKNLEQDARLLAHEGVISSQAGDLREIKNSMGMVVKMLEKTVK